MTKFNNPTGYVVVYKEGGFIVEFQRAPNKQMKIHNHYKTALNAWKKLGGNAEFNEGWFILSTVALAKSKWGNV